MNSQASHSRAGGALPVAWHPGCLGKGGAGPCQAAPPSPAGIKTSAAKFSPGSAPQDTAAAPRGPCW